MLARTRWSTWRNDGGLCGNLKACKMEGDRAIGAPFECGNEPGGWAASYWSGAR
jgi:hypothetical protein